MDIADILGIDFYFVRDLMLSLKEKGLLKAGNKKLNYMKSN